MQYNIKATVYDKRGRVLSIGYNSYIKTHPLMKKIGMKVGLPKKEYLHAEISALIKCREEPYRIVIERYGKDGKPLLAKPCPICQMAIIEKGIKVVEYTK